MGKSRWWKNWYQIVLCI